MTESRTTDAGHERRDSDRHQVRRPAAVFWPVLLGRGIWGIVFGFVTVFWRRDFTDPRFLSLPVRTVAVALAVFLVVGALLLAWQAVRGVVDLGEASSDPSAAGSRLRVIATAEVAANVIAAVLALFLAGTPRSLGLVMAAWALVFGGLELAAGLLLRRVVRGAQDFIVGGALFLALCAVLFAVTALGALGIFGLVGAVALMTGVLLVLGALTARRQNSGGVRPARTIP